MKILNVKSLSKRYDKYSTGIDYLRLSIPYNAEGEKKIEKLVSIKNSINTTNSNFRVIHFREHKVTFLRSSSQGNDTLTAILSYKGISVPIMFFCKYMEGRAKTFNSLGKVEVMGSFFRLIEVGEIKKDSELMQWLREIFEKGKITRLDYRIDYFSNNEKEIFKIGKVIQVGKKDKWQPFYEGKKIVGWRIGQRKHKRKVVRAYDKLKDTIEKGKFELYEDYFAYKSVHRLEYELLNKDLDGCKWEIVNQYIADLLHNIGIKKKEYLTIKDVENIFKGRKVIEEVKCEWEYFKKTKGYVKRCILAGINPFGIVQDVFNEVGYNSEEIKSIMQDFEERTNFQDTFRWSEAWYKRYICEDK